MKEDMKGFFESLPPEARRLVEDMNRPKRKAPAPEQREREESFSEFEEMVTGGGEPEIQAEDRMFDPPDPKPAPKPRAGRSMRDLIESITRKKQ